MSNMPAALANGRYQLGRLVGRGGMAEVYVALDTRLGRTVAVKIMRSDLANDEIFLSRFRREAHSVAQMNNPNIVNIYDSGEETVIGENGRAEHLPYLVMEYVQGQTLRDIIKTNGPLSQRDAEQVMIGVLGALEYSHHMGIIHRDIKPGNIMISDQGQVKVMDFGIARALDDSAATMTQSQGVVGTAQYLSPEQARGETVDMRSDLYSAGCVLYEMLTGRPPFTGDSAVAIAYQHVSEVATPPSVVMPGLPKMWDRICAKAMAKDRQNRYATAAEFRNDILTFMNGGTPVAAGFNPLTDLADLKRKHDEDNGGGSPTQVIDGGTPGGGSGGTPGGESGGERIRKRKARRKKRAIIIGSVLGGLALVAAIVAGIFLFRGSMSVETAVVPTITSQMTEAQARQKVREAGFRFRAETDRNSTLPQGTFTGRQQPKGGDTVAKDSLVRVWFSAGPRSIEIPDVKGRSQEEAREMLESDGFTVNASVLTENSADVGKGMVVRTDPAAGTSKPKGSAITLVVSTGMTQVPNVVGQASAQAKQTLQELGFAVTVYEEYNDTVPADQVIRMNPGAGAVVDQRSGVEIWISKGKEQVAVPGVSGMTLDKARAELAAAGLTVQVSGPDDGSAQVTGVNPAAGTEVDKGSTVTLTTKDGASTGTGGTEEGGGTGTGTDTGTVRPGPVQK